MLAALEVPALFEDLFEGLFAVGERHPGVAIPFGTRKPDCKVPSHRNSARFLNHTCSATGWQGERRRGALKCNGAKGQDGAMARRSHIALPDGVESYCGQAAPPSIQIFICATVFARESAGGMRPVPGFQAQPTRSSKETCSNNCASERPPVCWGSFNWRHSSAGVRPTKTILRSDAGSDHLGLPGGIFAPGKFAVWWQVSQRIPYTPWPSLPRFTFCRWTWLSSPCRGESPAGWQFWQRGDVKTL